MRTMHSFAKLIGAAWLMLAVTGVSHAQKATAPATDERPLNIVLLLIDDLGWKDLGCYGSTYYETPRIDRLAAEGMRFTDAYAACCVCSPTRASILTGQYPARLMLTEWLPSGRWDPQKYQLKGGRFLSALPLEEVTLAEALRAAGYRTAMIGKWHLGGPSYYFPRQHGFDVNIAGNEHGATGGHFYPYQGNWLIPTTKLRAQWRTLPDGVEGEYLTDRLTDEAVEFIRESKDGPFFLYLSHYAVHTPIQAKADMTARYEGKPISGGQDNAAYAAMVESVDQSVGRVLDELDALDVADDTLVIFTSDNGGHGRITSHTPLRGNKGNYYEGGIRVPTIVKWPGRAAPGGVSHEPVISNDFYPTILECVGLPNRPQNHQDGLSLAPLLTASGGLDRDAIFWHYPHYVTNHPNPATPMSVVRAGPWKLLHFYEDDRVELYNLDEDLGETHDQSAAMPEKASELRARLDRWRGEVGADPPRPNPQYVPKG